MRTLALALPLLVLAAGQAHAQDVTLVSNISVASFGNQATVGEEGSDTHRPGTQFTTGANSNGYLLKSLTLQVNGTQSGSAPKVSIYTSVNDEPGSELYTFTVPSAGVGKRTVTAQSNAALAASTSYFVVFEDTDTADGTWTVARTTSFTDYDTDSLTDWSLSGRIHSSNGGTTWGSIHTSQKIAVKLTGEVVGTTTTSTDATLSGLTLNDGSDDVDLDPTFASATEDYTASVGNAVDTITITPSFTDSGASVTEVTLGGTAIADTDFTDGISVPSLAVGENTIVVTVTAEDGTTTKTYTVVVTRQAKAQFVCADPDLSGRTEVWTADLGVGEDPQLALWYGYNAGTNAAGTLSPNKFRIGTSPTEYTVTALVEFDIGGADILQFKVNTDIPQADTDKLRLHVCGDTFDLSAATVSNVRTQYDWNPAILDWSTATTVKVALSSGDDSTSTDATLSALALADSGDNAVEFNETFAPGTVTYTADVANAVSTITVTPTKNDAKAADPVFLDGTDATLGDADTMTDGFQVELGVGDTVFKVKVTAEDGTTSETYTVTVTRADPAPSDCPADADWCATLTVGELEAFGAVVGYGFLSIPSPLQDVGALSDDDFTYAGTRYEVSRFQITAGADPGLILQFDPLGQTVFGRAGFVLTVGGQAFNFSDTTFDTASEQFQWANSGLSWSNGDTVTVSLKFAPISTVDTTPPAPESGDVQTTGDVLTLTFNEDLDITLTDLPPASAFTVEADGVAVAVSSVIGNVGELDTITLVLSTAVYAGQKVTVSYTKPGSGKVIEDAAGNETESFDTKDIEDFVMTNRSRIPAPPSLLLRKLELLEEPGGTSVDIPGFFRPGTYPDTVAPGLNYVSKVSQQATRVTVLAEPQKGTAVIEYQRRDGTAIEDADTSDDGYQVDLWGYANPIVMKVTNTENSVTTVTTYTLTVRRLGSPTQQAATGTPVIRGTARVGATLTLDASGIADANGTYFAEIGWPQHGFHVSWYVDTSTSDNPNVVRIIGSGGKVKLNGSHEGERIYVRVSFKDDLGNPETLVSDRTAAVQPQQLVISVPGGGAVVTGSRCDYVFPAGPHCDGETSARDVGKPLKVVNNSGINVTSQATFSVKNPTTVIRRDEFGALHRASYVFNITSGGQLRTVADETYPHVEGPLCRRRAAEPHACHPGTIRSWSLDPVYVEVTAETGDGKGGTYRIPVWVLKHPSAVPVSSAGDMRCDGKRCYGRSLAPGQEMYEPGFTPAYTLKSEGGAPLQASFEDAPQTHDGKTAFTLRLVLSEPVETHADAFRDDVFQVKGGSVTGAALVGGSDAQWEITVAPDGNDAVSVVLPSTTDCAAAGAVCTGDGRALSEMAAAAVAGPGQTPAPSPLTAKFTNGPGTHDGASAFNVFLRFSEAPANVKNIHIERALTIAGGKILRVRVVGGVHGDEAHRRVEIEPSGDGEVRLSLSPTTDCAAANALCTADGRKLESLISLSIPGPVSEPPPPAPITATFENVPKEHQGKKRLDLHVRFSEPPTGGKQAVAASLTMARAAKWGVKGLDSTGHLYRSALRPHSFRPITVRLKPTADCTAAGALCTAAGGKLETGISVTIPGPVAIRVADATVEEAAGAVLAFAVTLDRVRHDTVTVDYATENGTATAGEDYTAASGTLTFAAGETAKTVEVAVLDDLHDEGNETMVLRLSNPSGARIADGEATGTIENTDLMPQAWLARFGRTVAEQVIEAVETRMRAPRSPGAEVSLAGRRIGLGPLFGADAAPEDGDAALAKRAREAEAEAQEGQRRLAAWLRGAAEEEERPGLETQTVTERELLLGSSFSLTAAPGDGGPGAVSLWGRAAVSRFDGREDGLTLDGEVASGLLGAEWARERSTLGLILSHSRGEGGYRGDAGSGTVSSTLTGLYPWGRHALNERVTVWGVAGYGAGTLTLTPEGPDGESRAAMRTDMDLMMGAVGLRGVVVRAPAAGGPELSLKTDALGVRTTSAKVRGLAASEADVTRLRLGLEGTWRGLAIGSGTLAPRLEVGVRHDGGDAETGFGLDLGGGLAWSDPGTGIRAEVSGRGLLTHESAGFRDRGIAGSFGWDPAPGSNRGPSLSLTQTMGLSATGGADALLGRTTLEGLAANDDGDELDRRRLELRLGYGFAAFGDRFTSTPEAGFGMSEGRRDYSLGWRLVRDPWPGGIGSLELLFEARRQESANDNAAVEPEHSLGFRLTARF